MYYKPDIGAEERVTNIKAYTFNLENNSIKKTKLSSKNVFKEQISTDWSVKKLAIPNIKVGSVIDIGYKIVSPYFYKIDDLEFQFDLPVKKIDYSVSIPEYYKFKKFSKGYYSITPEVERKRKSIILTSKIRSGSRISQTNFERSEVEYMSEFSSYTANNIPALKNDEPFVYSFYNYRGGLKFELTQTNFVDIGGNIKNYANSWQNVAKQVYKSAAFGGELSKNSYFKKDIDGLLSAVKSDFDKIAAIFQYVKGSVKWNGTYGKFTQKGVKKAYKEKE